MSCKFLDLAKKNLGATKMLRDKNLVQKLFGQKKLSGYWGSISVKDKCC